MTTREHILKRSVFTVCADRQQPCRRSVVDNDVTFLYLQNAYDRTSYQRGLFLIFVLKITSLDPVVSIFTARRSYASAVFEVVILSVCPSVTRAVCD